MASAIVVLLVSATGAQQNGKIKFDLSKLDEHGLQGPPDGLRALDYEFCIPGQKRYADEVKAIDPRVNIHTRSPGDRQHPPAGLSGNTCQTGGPALRPADRADLLRVTAAPLDRRRPIGTPKRRGANSA
jgi:hypothetical protein